MSLSVENVTEMKKSKQFLLSFKNKSPEAFFLWTEFLHLLTRGFILKYVQTVEQAVTWRAP